MKHLSPAVEWNGALFNQSNQAVPCYTSYPPATELTTGFDANAFIAAIAIGNHQQTPLSLYCHIPFCETPCGFCGCNTIITILQNPIALQSPDELAIAPQARQLHRHFPGDTPHPKSDRLGFGMTAISVLPDVHSPNHQRLQDCDRAIDADELPIAKGVRLRQDDRIRCTGMMERMCQFQWSVPDLAAQYPFGFDRDRTTQTFFTAI